MTDPLQRLLDSKRVVLADGATGTHLRWLIEAAGLGPSPACELLNEQRPDIVRQHYRGYAEAGSDIILTNSWAANRYALADAGVDASPERIQTINRASVQLLTEEIVASGRSILSAGSVGPTGSVVIDPEDTGRPIGEYEIRYSDAVAAFSEQITALAAGGVDVIWIETQLSPHEVNAAIDGCKVAGNQVGRNIPFVISMTFNKFERTQEEYDLEHFAIEFGPAAGLGRAERQATAFGINCGYGPEVALASVAHNPRLWPAGAPLLLKPNCDLPRYLSRRFQPTALSPGQMARFAQLAADYGARIVGACCGSTPEHIVAMRRALNDYRPSPTTSAEAIHDELERAS